MSSRKTTVFYAMLICVASLAVGMVIASRLNLTPPSMAQPDDGATGASNSAPLGGALDAGTFRNIAKTVSPSVVNIRTEVKQKSQDLTEFFGGGGNDDLLERFFGGQTPRGQGRPGPVSPRTGGGSQRHRLHHQQGWLHPHQQPRRRERDQDRGRSSMVKRATSATRGRSWA